MEITKYTLEVMLLFAPGVIAYYLFTQMTRHRAKSAPLAAVAGGSLALISYFLLWVVKKALGLFGVNGAGLELLAKFSGSGGPLNFWEILWASIIATFVGAAVAAVHNHKWLFRAARTLRVSSLSGHQETWGYYLETTAEWVTVRDISNGLVYDGFMESFSSENVERQIVLGDVAVSKNTSGEHLYDVDRLYLRFTNESIFSIEQRTEVDKYEETTAEISNSQKPQNTATPDEFCAAKTHNAPA